MTKDEALDLRADFLKSMKFRDSDREIINLAAGTLIVWLYLNNFVIESRTIDNEWMEKMDRAESDRKTSN